MERLEIAEIVTILHNPEISGLCAYAPCRIKAWQVRGSVRMRIIIIPRGGVRMRIIPAR
jgi:hypothetical protein